MRRSRPAACAVTRRSGDASGGVQPGGLTDQVVPLKVAASTRLAYRLRPSRISRSSVRMLLVKFEAWLSVMYAVGCWRSNTASGHRVDQQGGARR